MTRGELSTESQNVGRIVMVGMRLGDKRRPVEGNEDGRQFFLYESDEYLCQKQGNKVSSYHAYGRYADVRRMCWQPAA